MADSFGYLYRIGEVIPGTKLRVRGHLGFGGMGSVYDVSAPSDGLRYVVKVLHPHLLKGPLIRERLRKEAVLLTEFEHAHIVQVVFTGETADEPPLPYYAMERLYGCAASDALLKVGTGGFPLLPAFEVMLELLSALGYAHQRAVVHRDVKLENIFLHFDASGQRVTKLLDFGIVRILREARATVAGFVGTLGTAAPEQLRNEDPTPACDIYSAGVVFYQLLTSHNPFGDLHDAKAIVQAHLFRKPDPASKRRGVPRGLDELILAMLEKDPKNRPGASEVASAIEALVTTVARADPVDPSELVERWRSVEGELRSRAALALSAPELAMPSPGRGSSNSRIAGGSATEGPQADALLTSELAGIEGLSLPLSVADHGELQGGQPANAPAPGSMAGQVVAGVAFDSRAEANTASGSRGWTSLASPPNPRPEQREYKSAGPSGPSGTILLPMPNEMVRGIADAGASDSRGTTAPLRRDAFVRQGHVALVVSGAIGGAALAALGILWRVHVSATVTPPTAPTEGVPATETRNGDAARPRVPSAAVQPEAVNQVDAQAGTTESPAAAMDPPVLPDATANDARAHAGGPLAPSRPSGRSHRAKALTPSKPAPSGESEDTSPLLSPSWPKLPSGAASSTR